MFTSGDNRLVWRRLQPGDEAGLCRAFAEWDEERPGLGHWASGPGLPYAACIQGASRQFVVDRGDDYQSPCREDEPRTLVGNDAVYVLVGGSGAYLAADKAAPVTVDIYAALNDVLSWLWYCGLRGDADTSVLLDGAVERSIIAVNRSHVERHPIAWIG